MTNNDAHEVAIETDVSKSKFSSDKNSFFETIDIKNLLISLVAGLLGAMLFIIVQNHIYGKTYGVIQLNKLLTQHIKEYSAKTTDKEKIDTLTAKYAAALEQAIKELESKNIVLLVDAAVVTKLPDYTDYVKAEIDRKLESQ